MYSPTPPPVKYDSPYSAADSSGDGTGSRWTRPQSGQVAYDQVPLLSSGRGAASLPQPGHSRVAAVTAPADGAGATRTGGQWQGWTTSCAPPTSRTACLGAPVG